MKICDQWKTCKHMTCYHIVKHQSHDNCTEHECFFDEGFRKCKCMQIAEPEIGIETEQVTKMLNMQPKITKSIVSEVIAARDKWWMEKIFAKCPHSTDFRIAAECMICLRQFTGEIELKGE